MAGNVLEWTRSRFAGYPYDPRDGRENLEVMGNEIRVLRGGACFNNARYVRCAARYYRNPYFRFNYYGFRVLVLPSSDL